MKKKSGNVNKMLVLTICLITMMCITIFGTLAYLTDEATVTNTFTVGDVDITVDEAKVDADGVPVEPEVRVIENQYHLIPGQTYAKDPTMTVLANSEDAYVRMMVTINCLEEMDEIFNEYVGSVITYIFEGYNSAEWTYITETRNNDNTITYEFRYKEPVATSNADQKLAPLFTAITMPTTLTAEDMEKMADLEIIVEGHAIQMIGFEDADEAWAAFAEEN